MKALGRMAVAGAFTVALAAPGAVRADDPGVKPGAAGADAATVRTTQPAVSKGVRLHGMKARGGTDASKSLQAKRLLQELRIIEADEARLKTYKLPTSTPEAGLPEASRSRAPALRDAKNDVPGVPGLK
jgi:hypothetical protein